MSQHYDREAAASGLITRRRFLGATATGMAASGLSSVSRLAGAEPAADKVIVGAHPWVYAATQPKCDITPILPRISADMEYAGMQGIELMHTALRPKDAVIELAHERDFKPTRPIRESLKISREFVRKVLG